MSFHQTTVLGNVGSDSELRFTPSGVAVASFSLAVNETYGEKQTTTWYRVTLWDKQAEKLSEYITKGKQLLVIGTVSARAYPGKDGNPAASLELRAQTVRFVGAKGSAGSSDPTDSVSVGDGPEIPF